MPLPFCLPLHIEMTTLETRQQWLQGLFPELWLPALSSASCRHRLNYCSSGSPLKYIYFILKFFCHFLTTSPFWSVLGPCWIKLALALIPMDISKSWKKTRCLMRFKSIKGLFLQSWRNSVTLTILMWNLIEVFLKTKYVAFPGSFYSMCSLTPSQKCLRLAREEFPLQRPCWSHPAGSVQGTVLTHFLRHLVCHYGPNQLSWKGSQIQSSVVSHISNEAFLCL